MCFRSGQEGAEIVDKFQGFLSRRLDIAATSPQQILCVELIPRQNLQTESARQSTSGLAKTKTCKSGASNWSMEVSSLSTLGMDRKYFRRMPVLNG